MQTAQKALFQSPFSRRTLDLTETPTGRDSSSSSNSAEGGATMPKEKTSTTTTAEPIIT